ncbi:MULTISPECIES: ATP-binding protein [Streptomyces]|uniref:Histidine kinase-, DNA gyrase B-, and HSP90-like ATPase n=1 Tax=Streptomyces chartreusis NRRL 3882 TaxID=1079985 RepID=A0A2N9BJL8_STRCX|nr:MULTISPECIES: ATP-binding protein [Streptomyces]MYS90477.1 ATP-binding protein [Streptomyces sp. SID5464]SOR83560.1 Histidine kinase-, DNA gyrase B-, and HSP90-like ATPase [Streptomyces chartreusis NRRL 3882]
MVLPLGKQAADRPGADEHATLRFGAAWADGAASAVDARLALRAFLAHGPHPAPALIPASLAMDAELVVSELVTNAIRHAPGPCELILRLFRGKLAITVRDTSAEQPAVQKGDRFRVGGHGLRLVHTVSDRVAVAPRARGKQITAYLRLAPNDHVNAGADRTVLAAG